MNSEQKRQAGLLIHVYSDLVDYDNGHGTVVAYHDGWDDARIAKAVGVEVHSIIVFRLVHYGRLDHPTAASVPINSKPTPPDGPSPTHGSQRSGPSGKPLPPGMGTAGAAPVPTAIPSQHGGKLIPVVRSHAAIAAAKRAATVNSGDQLTDKSYVLVGQRAEDSSIKVIEHWPYLPTQTEVEAATKNLKYKYTRFALVNPQRTWDAP